MPNVWQIGIFILYLHHEQKYKNIMRRWTRLLPYFIVEWLAKNNGDVISIKGQEWFVLYHKDRLGDAFYVRKTKNYE